MLNTLVIVMLSASVLQAQSNFKLPPIPEISEKQPINSVPMGDSASMPEVKIKLPIASGPFEPTWESIEKNYPGSPDWLREAKFGIWVHFGPQAAGMSGDWYARKLYVPGTEAYNNHLKTYGHPSEAGYKEVLRDWNPKKLDPAKLTAIYKDAGARFLMIQGVHHDNFDLWNSRHQPWNSTRMGPKRDLMGEWAAAARKTDMRYGITFHHEYSWWWWQTSFGADTTGAKSGVPYDGNLTLADGKGKWWEGLDPRMLYNVDLREYQTVDSAAHSPWSPPKAGVFDRHLEYAKWYATWWAARMTDAIDQYDPDFIYTDGTGKQPFEGANTGTGIKADAMQRVIAHFYNKALSRRGKVNTFSIVKFRHPTNGTVNTEEFGVPAEINTKQPWIAEIPVGDWFYAPGFFYDSGMMIRYIIEAVARDGNACICVSLLPDGSLDEGSLRMLKEVGAWMRANGQGIYGSKAWTSPGEGEVVNGRPKQLPGGKLGKQHAEFKFGPQDFRFTVGKDGALYAYCLTVPPAGTQLTIKSFGTAGLSERKIQSVSLLGDRQRVKWKQEVDALNIEMPAGKFATAVGFRIQ